jgi:RimJ/RimL family protein N-acetyltransferase
MYSHHLQQALADARTDDIVRAVPDPAARVHVRPIVPADKPALAAFVAGLSPQSRYRRFLVAKASLSKRELAYFTEIDHRRHEALVAFDGARLVGLSQYAGWPAEPHAAELAIAIADDHQGRGLGMTLAAALVERGRANGLARLTASTHAGNRACRRLLGRLGFEPCGYEDGLVEYELHLSRAAAAP